MSIWCESSFGNKSKPALFFPRMNTTLRFNSTLQAFVLCFLLKQRTRVKHRRQHTCNLNGAVFPQQYVAGFHIPEVKKHTITVKTTQSRGAALILPSQWTSPAAHLERCPRGLIEVCACIAVTLKRQTQQPQLLLHLCNIRLTASEFTFSAIVNSAFFLQGFLFMLCNEWIQTAFGWKELIVCSSVTCVSVHFCAGSPGPPGLLLIL